MTKDFSNCIHLHFGLWKKHWQGSSLKYYTWKVKRVIIFTSHAFNKGVFYRATPFANGASDNPDGILKRIGEGNLKMDSGNWLSVSSEAKVKAKTFFTTTQK